jgi:integrase
MKTKYRSASKVKNISCLDALERYIDIKSSSKAPKTIANNALVVRNWMKGAKVQDAPLSSVTSKHIDRWINNPRLTWKRSTRIAALGSVRAFFDFCLDHGLVELDPARQVELNYSVMTHEQKESPEKQPFSQDELEKLISALNHDWDLAQTDRHTLFRDKYAVLFWLVAVHLSKETGLRISDIASLEWRSIGEVDKLVVWTEKTNKRMEFKISQTVQELIAQVPVDTGNHIFPHQHEINQSLTRRAGLSEQFGRLCKRVGIEGKTFHSLRHYKATQAYENLGKVELAKKLAEVLTIEQIAAMLGHSNRKTTQGYVHK